MNKQKKQLKYNILSSSSSGNAIVYHDEILLDCGVTYKTLLTHLNKIKIVLLTHIHQDHTKVETIKKVNENYPNIVWLCPEWLYEQISCLVNRCYKITIGKTYNILTYEITPILLYHNVQNCGYRIITSDYKILHATDTCTLEGISAKNYDLYAIEFNWDEETINDIIREKQENGEYAYEAESKLNHLSFQKAKKYFDENKKDDSELIKLHISSKYLDKNSKWYKEEII